MPVIPVSTTPTAIPLDRWIATTIRDAFTLVARSQVTVICSGSKAYTVDLEVHQALGPAQVIGRLYFHSGDPALVNRDENALLAEAYGQALQYGFDHVFDAAKVSAAQQVLQSAAQTLPAIPSVPAAHPLPSFTWTYRLSNINTTVTATKDNRYDATPKPRDHDGENCDMCSEFAPMAEVNMPGGKFRCYQCRNADWRPGTKRPEAE